MSKKLDRMFRDRKLSAAEIEQEEDVRRKVREEFPPATTANGTSGALSQVLRNALRASDKSMDQIAQAAGVSQTVLSRFLAGESDIHMTAADKLAAAVGLTPMHSGN